MILVNLNKIIDRCMYPFVLRKQQMLACRSLSAESSFCFIRKKPLLNIPISYVVDENIKVLYDDHCLLGQPLNPHRWYFSSSCLSSTFMSGLPKVAQRA